jgi:hypothetical protein
MRPAVDVGNVFAATLAVLVFCGACGTGTPEKGAGVQAPVAADSEQLTQRVNSEIGRILNAGHMDESAKQFVRELLANPDAGVQARGLAVLAPASKLGDEERRYAQARMREMIETATREWKPFWIMGFGNVSGLFQPTQDDDKQIAHSNANAQAEAVISELKASSATADPLGLAGEFLMSEDFSIKAAAVALLYDATQLKPELRAGAIKLLDEEIASSRDAEQEMWTLLRDQIAKAEPAH